MTTPLPTVEIRKLVTNLLDLEKQIKELQDAKSTIYKSTKGNFGAGIASGLKTAVGLLRLEPQEREQKLAAGGFALEILKIVDDDSETTPAHANENTPAEPGFVGWKKQRDLERAKPFAPDRDPETGEILGPETITPFVEAMGELGVTLADLDIPIAA